MQSLWIIYRVQSGIFMQVTTSVAIMQVLRLYFHCVVGTSVTVILVDLSSAIMHVNVSVAIIQLEVAEALM